MTWLKLLFSAGLVVVAAIKLAEYGDVIGIRTRLGGMFVGTLLLAGATSLPELLASITSLDQAVPNLAAGNVFGSQMMNMMLLAVLDILAGNARLLRRAARKHAMSASLAILLTLAPAVSLLAGIKGGIGWVGWDSLALIVAYLVGVRLLQGDRVDIAPLDDEQEEEGPRIPSLKVAIIGFLVASGVLVAVMPMLVNASTEVAEQLGLTVGFVGSTLLALITSLPELVACITAVRIGAHDMAMGNLFGSNMFNMFGLGLVDVFYTKGLFLSEIDPSFALVALLAAVLTGIALVGNLADVKRRRIVLELDAAIILLGYAAGLWLIYSRGIGL
ncbi:MAG: sodium:calcium antiporter [Chloroflexi bacterium]|nr:sodium:calcium antiporter [Chloroflexota bacterium]